MTKQLARDEARAAIRALDAGALARASARLCEFVIDADCFRAASVVMGYLPIAGEIDVRGVLQAGIGAGKTVCLPRVLADKTGMVPVAVRDLATDTSPGVFRIPEPHAQTPAVPLANVELILVPGLAFTPRGDRLGRGGGFYDRLLGAKTCAATRIGVCHSALLRERLPVEVHDVPVHAVATDSGIRWV
jgi:5-formyltetrahydrofolate cyclo-ligase